MPEKPSVHDAPSLYEMTATVGNFDTETQARRFALLALNAVNILDAVAKTDGDDGWYVVLTLDARYVEATGTTIP